MCFYLVDVDGYVLYESQSRLEVEIFLDEYFSDKEIDERCIDIIEGK